MQELSRCGDVQLRGSSDELVGLCSFNARGLKCKKTDLAIEADLLSLPLCPTCWTEACLSQQHLIWVEGLQAIMVSTIIVQKPLSLISLSPRIIKLLKLNISISSIPVGSCYDFPSNIAEPFCHQISFSYRGAWKPRSYLLSPHQAAFVNDLFLCCVQLYTQERR